MKVFQKTGRLRRPVSREALWGNASLSALVLLILGLTACGPSPSSHDSSPIDVLSAPEMTGQPPEILKFSEKGYEFTLTLKAAYTVRGVVIGREDYKLGWQADLSPADVALCWGKLAEGDLYKRLTWSQGNRWYYWRHDGRFPYDNAFVARHSSNNHIIPAAPQIAKALRLIKPGDAVEMRGYLVDIAGRKRSETVHWNSSTSTTDSGNGACEVLYLKALKVHGKIYG